MIFGRIVEQVNTKYCLSVQLDPFGNKDGNSWVLVIKKNFMLNSAEHKILNAHKYKNINKFSIFRLR